MSAEEPRKYQNRPIRQRIREGLETARQWVQPAAVRTAASREPEQPADSYAADEPARARADEQLAAALKTLAAVATAVWRAKNKLDAKSEVALPDGLRNLPRYIQSAWDALEAGNIQVDDPTGRRYVPGMAVNALTMQSLDGITFEVIHETIKPSVYFNDVLIQRADVIVASPTNETDKDGLCDEAIKKPDSGDHHEASDQKGQNADGPDNH